MVCWILLCCVIIEINLRGFILKIFFVIINMELLLVRILSFRRDLFCGIINLDHCLEINDALWKFVALFLSWNRWCNAALCCLIAVLEFMKFILSLFCFLSISSFNKFSLSLCHYVAWFLSWYIWNYHFHYVAHFLFWNQWNSLCHCITLFLSLFFYVYHLMSWNKWNYLFHCDIL